ncbi:spore-associated protein A [Nocardia sp. NPDC059180]|uniref:spore-associated protein A n=1 Tax=Nocardia sp. NPDC059180 TaxID=3346761 RepID=UPI0036B2F81A
MLNTRKAIAVCAGAIGIAAGTAVLLPATASAATYGGQCGAGFKVIDSHELKGGTVFLTYNGSKNCVVTVRDKPGDPIRMGAGLRLSSDHDKEVIDDDQYKEYAGPVTVEAKGQCIDWGGLIADDKWQTFKVHCR